MTLSVVVALVVAVTSITLLQQAKLTEDVTYLPRVKSTQSVIEGNLRILAQQSVSYQCASNDMSSCSINTGLFNELIEQAKKACGNPEACQFQLDNPRFDSASQSFRATLRNNSTVVSLADREIVIDVPPEVFYRAQMLCPDEAPFFLGFNSFGQPQCRALGWSGPTNCPAGQFVRAIDGRTLSVSCGSLQNTVTCPAGQVLRGLRWANEGGFESLGCAPKISPYQFWSFTPDVDTSGVAIIDDTLPTPTAPADYSEFRGTTPIVPPPAVPGPPLVPGPPAAGGPPSGPTTPLTAECGSAINPTSPYSTAPHSGLCTVGIASAVIEEATSYTWSCSEGTTTASCAGPKAGAPAPPAPSCEWQFTGFPSAAPSGSSCDYEIGPFYPAGTSCSAGSPEIVGGACLDNVTYGTYTMSCVCN